VVAVINTEYRDFFNHVRTLYNSGAISYDQAKELTSDKISELNNKGKEIAQKHGRRFVPFTFSQLMR